MTQVPRTYNVLDYYQSGQTPGASAAADTAAFKAAFLAAKNSGVFGSAGGTIYVPPGIYKIQPSSEAMLANNTALILWESCVLVGDNPANTILMLDAPSASTDQNGAGWNLPARILFLESNTRVSGIWFHGDRLNIYRKPVADAATADILVRTAVRISGQTRTGTENVQVSDCWLTHQYSDELLHVDTPGFKEGFGLAVTLCDHVWIENSVFAYNTGSGLNIGTRGIEVSDHVYISHCEAMYNGWRAQTINNVKTLITPENETQSSTGPVAVPRGSSAAGYTTYGAKILTFLACHAYGNARVGFNTEFSESVKYIGCRSYRNRWRGFNVNGVLEHIVWDSCESYDNGGSRYSRKVNVTTGVFQAIALETPIESMEIAINGGKKAWDFLADPVGEEVDDIPYAGNPREVSILNCDVRPKAGIPHLGVNAYDRPDNQTNWGYGMDFQVDSPGCEDWWYVGRVETFYDYTEDIDNTSTPTSYHSLWTGSAYTGLTADDIWPPSGQRLVPKTDWYLGYQDTTHPGYASTQAELNYYWVDTLSGARPKPWVLDWNFRTRLGSSSIYATTDNGYRQRRDPRNRFVGLWRFPGLERARILPMSKITAWSTATGTGSGTPTISVTTAPGYAANLRRAQTGYRISGGALGDRVLCAVPNTADLMASLHILHTGVQGESRWAFEVIDGTGQVIDQTLIHLTGNELLETSSSNPARKKKEESFATLISRPSQIRLAADPGLFLQIRRMEGTGDLLFEGPFVRILTDWVSDQTYLRENRKTVWGSASPGTTADAEDTPAGSIMLRESPSLLQTWGYMAQNTGTAGQVAWRALGTLQYDGTQPKYTSLETTAGLTIGTDLAVGGDATIGDDLTVTGDVVAATLKAGASTAVPLKGIYEETLTLSLPQIAANSVYEYEHTIAVTGYTPSTADRVLVNAGAMNNGILIGEAGIANVGGTLKARLRFANVTTAAITPTASLGFRVTYFDVS